VTPNLTADKIDLSESEPTKIIQKQLFTKAIDSEDTKTKCLNNSAKNEELKELCDRLWTAADELRANSALRSTQYSSPVLGLIFLRYADHKFEETTNKLKTESSVNNQPIRKLDYLSECVYLTENARYNYLLNLPEEASLGKAIDNAMRTIETENEELRDVLPKNYVGIGDKVLVNLIKLFHKIPTELDQDIFGKIYEYFLGEFAKAEGQGAGEFYTPTSIVRLIVEIIQPYHGRILDPACGSGGMFVQSAEFVKDHLKNPYKEISIYGQEKTDEIVRLCKMNLAVHGLSGDIKQSNTYYEDVFNMRGQFDFVMANPPFNVNNVDKEAIKDDPRYPFGIPNVDNANYLWIQIFNSMLNDRGRAGFVMANSASDAGSSELEIRKELVKNDQLDVIISVASRFFYSVSLAVTLWFFNKNKVDSNKKTVLFIDARDIYRKIDRAHVEFTQQQIEFISNIVRMYRGEKIETVNCSSSMIEEHFPNQHYRDVPGLCKVATIEEIEEQNFALTAGRYVNIKSQNIDATDFKELVRRNSEELKQLKIKSDQVEKSILEILSELEDTI
jgi:type I restriction enzyme M protein